MDFIFDLNDGTEGIVCALDSPLHIEGEATIGLRQLHVKFANPPVICFDLCCNICGPTYVNGVLTPHLLKRIHVDRAGRTTQQYNPIHYIPIVKSYIDTIEVYLSNIQTNAASFELETFSCTLHLQQ